MNATLSIQGERLYAALHALGDIGGYDDTYAGVRGVNRLALSAADAQGRRHVVAAMRAAGLNVSIDKIGNVFGRRHGQDNTLAPVMIGSHIDSVATAGIFDGCLGVLGGLEIVHTLNDTGRATRRPIVVGFFTEEEGARFGTDMLGSAVATGRLALDDAYALRDRAGLCVVDELRAVGFLGDVDAQMSPPYVYVECHIEQGPVLRASGHDIGVVTGVSAICWHELTIVGRSAHAGTTPMALRADAGVAAARINLGLRDLVTSGAYGDGLRATMGVVATHPGLVNVVPGRATATVDLRHPDDGVVQRVERAVEALYAEVAQREGVRIIHRRTARTPDVVFDPKVRVRVATCATARGLSHAEIVSGAGHDAQELARICPSGMVFVPGERDGVSHNPLEFSTREQCEHGVNVLLDVVLSFADEGIGV